MNWFKKREYEMLRNRRQNQLCRLPIETTIVKNRLVSMMPKISTAPRMHVNPVSG